MTEPLVMRIVLPVAFLLWMFLGVITTAQEPTPIVVRFPAEQSIGMFRVESSFARTADRWQSPEPPYQSAQGRIEVPPDRTVVLHFAPPEDSQAVRQSLVELLDGVRHQGRPVDFALLNGIPATVLSGLHVNRAYIGVAEISNLRRFTRLRSLLLDQCVLDSNAMQRLGQLKTLEHLLIRPAAQPQRGLLNDDDFRSLNALEHLERLDLISPGVSGSELSGLTRLTKLTSLRLSGHGFRPDCLQYVKQFPALRTLDAEGFVTDESLSLLGGNSDLLVMNLSGSPLQGYGLVHLKSVGHLQELCLAASQITDEGLASLPPLLSVRTLDLSRTNIGLRGLRHLRKLRFLTQLDLSGVPIDDECLAELAERRSLTYLRLAHVRTISSQGILQLASLKQLWRLDLRGASVTIEAAELIQQALPKCEVLFLGLEREVSVRDAVEIRRRQRADERFDPLRGLGE